MQAGSKECYNQMGCFFLEDHKKSCEAHLGYYDFFDKKIKILSLKKVSIRTLAESPK